ncbi:hypothetical protein EVAR_73140_1 [Eumeta japonica]|uniref:MADF domain-containing protein n=1 Tax=Eumeta variegata TaxID=151549 RepID=A0A4C1T9X5_EUMVA|nr:hypothetical protein EVAR_73140_1 [Eumeta japonica]
MSRFSSDFEIKELIHQYKEHDCLWNIHSANYKNKPLKTRAWAEIANFFHKTPNEVKRKMRYLRAAYVHEKRRVDASKKSDPEAPHTPSLFYYKEMDF